MVMDFSSNYVPYHVELNSIIASCNGNGVLNGLEITAQSTPSLMIDYSAGKCFIDNELYEESSSYITLSAGHSTYSRIDMVYYNTAVNGISVVNGVATSSPVPPDIPDNDLLLALVNVPANDTTIESTQIIDERIFVESARLYYAAYYTASDVLLKSSDSEEYHLGGGYTKEKEIAAMPYDLYSNDSTLRIKFDIKTTDTEVPVYGRVYRNGIAVGTERETYSATYANFTQDISGWSAGDLIQLYTYSGDADVISVCVQNFRIYGDLDSKNMIDW